MARLIVLLLLFVPVFVCAFAESSKRDSSPPQYKVKIIYTRVPMRDGVELAVKITRPDAEGRFPGIMEYNPYRRIKKALSDYREEYPPAVPYLARARICRCAIRRTWNGQLRRMEQGHLLRR